VGGDGFVHRFDGLIDGLIVRQSFWLRTPYHRLDRLED